MNTPELACPAKMSHWFQPLPPEHPRTCPGIIPADGSCYLYLDYAELRHDSHQWDVRPREPSRQHESRLLIRVGDDSIGWEGTPARPCRQLRGCPGQPVRSRAPS